MSSLQVSRVKRFALAAIPAALAFSLSACNGDDGATGPTGADGSNGTDGVSSFVTRNDVVTTNANIAYAAYSDSLVTAMQLRSALQSLVSMPTEANFTAAKQAWLDAREPYGQTEVYRFRVGPIDALKADGTIGEEGDGPEGRINAWPLGEAIIDYVAPVVDGDSGPEGDPAITGNIIQNASDNGTVITKQTLLDLFEAGDDERNVTTGYHAIEFLLWGQDLNLDGAGAGLRDATAGHRPVTDFQHTGTGNVNACTAGAIAAVDSVCVARGQYLLAAADVLIDDLTTVANAWEPSVGAHYQAFVAGGDVSLAKILEGMGRLSYGELAGERMNIALVTDSQEDEHSCFSDNTHRDIYLNAKGVQNSYLGTYTRVNGEIIEGAGIDDLLVVEGQHELANTLRGALEGTMSAASVIDVKAQTGTPFDNLIQQGIDQPNVKAVINGLISQTDSIEQAITALGVTAGDLRQDTDQSL